MIVALGYLFRETAPGCCCYLVVADNNSTYGGAISIEYAESKDDLKSTVKIKRSKFLNNYVKAKYSGMGGAIRSRRSIDIENSLFVNNRAISNNGGTGQQTLGGAIGLDHNWYGSNSYEGGTANIKNSTFHGNYIKTLSSSSPGAMIGAAIAYGLYNDADAKTFIFNTIITGSRALVVDDTTDFDTSSLSDWYKKRLIIGEINSGSISVIKYF